MERHTALSLLDLPDYANEAQIMASAERKRAELEERLAKAPIMALKAKYRSEIERVKLAVDVLTAEVTSGSEFEDLPVSQKIDTENYAVEPPTSRSQAGGRPPPERLGPHDADRSPYEPSSGRAPPQRRGASVPPPLPSNVDYRGDVIGRRPPSRMAKKATQAGSHLQEQDEYLEEGQGTPLRQRDPMNPKVFWSTMAAVVVLVAGIGYAAWRFWWMPGQFAERAEAGHSVLSGVSGDLSSLPMQGELVHAKARALCQMAISMGSTDHRTEAGSFITEATNIINELPEGATKNEDTCRLIASQAAVGNMQAAVTALVTMQSEREKAERKGRPAAANAPPSRTPVHEDLARRAIAMALARQGQPEQALRLVESISQNNDTLACEALGEIARQFIARKDNAQALQTLQAMETRAKRVSDPIRRAPLLTFVAERMYAMQGAAKAKQWVSDALSGITSGSGGSASGYPDYEARKAIAQALMLPTQLRAGGEQKDTYRKKLEDVTALAANLQATMGAISGTPDFQNRAIAYSHVAVAWHELGKRWFSGDANDRAADAIAKALQAVEQVRPPAEADLAEAAIDKKEEALVAIISALAVMHQFEQARSLSQNLTLAENQGPAAEAIAYHLGQSGHVEEGQTYVRSLVAGEPRIRAAIGLHYGLNALPLEKWW